MTFAIQDIVRDYLSSLKESRELDAILPDLLRAMEFKIIRSAFQGELQHGVDIAAVWEGSDETILNLFVVKQGNLDSDTWDSGPNSVRSTLNTILDAPFQDLSRPKLRQATRKTILVFNGEIRRNIEQNINGYLEQTFRPKMDFECWNLDDLTEHFYNHLLHEKFLIKPYQPTFKRILAFLDVRDYSFEDFKVLLQRLLPDKSKLSIKERSRLFAFVRLVLAMIRHKCQEPELNNLTPALLAYEHALLATWDWMKRNKLFQQPNMTEFQRTYEQYVDLLDRWAKKIEPTLQSPDGLALNYTFERVEYPLRFFSVIGNLGLRALHYLWQPDSDTKAEQVKQSIDLIVDNVRNNRVRHRPLLDNHMIDIFLGIWPLILDGRTDFARWWLADLFEHMTIRKEKMGRFPELYNNMNAVIEFEVTDRRPFDYIDSSSTLLYMMFELCLVLDAEDLYLQYRQVFQDMPLQIWSPPVNAEDQFYEREVWNGDTEIIHALPSDFEEFRLDVQARHHRWGRLSLSTLEHKMPIILLLANKHFRTPVFPFLWRTKIFDEVNLVN